MFFDGVFSDGLRRVPVAGEFRINTPYGGRMEPVTLEPDVVDAMAAVLTLLPERPLYARDLVAGAAERVADAVIAGLSNPAARPPHYGTDVRPV